MLKRRLILRTTLLILVVLIFTANIFCDDFAVGDPVDVYNVWPTNIIPDGAVVLESPDIEDAVLIDYEGTIYIVYDPVVE